MWSILGYSCLFKMKDNAPFSRGNNGEIVKLVCKYLICKYLKIFLWNWTTGPILAKLGTKHLWVKRIQICSNKVPRLFQRGDNCKTAKINSRNIKVIRSISTKLGIKHSKVKRAQGFVKTDHLIIKRILLVFSPFQINTMI